jgi:hypothetical protein
VGEAARDEKISPPEPDPTVNPRQVFDGLAKTNPFFQHWLEFRSKLPSPDPESWDEFAEAEVAEGDQGYARAMRELGQMLLSLIQRKKQIRAMPVFNLAFTTPQE